MPSITQLQYLVAVEKHRHFGQAARSCFVSQPSLSMQIQKVEDELGFAIFDRNKKPVIPTDRGRRVIEQAKKVLFEEQKLVEIAKSDAAVVSGEFKLGVIPTLAPYLLPLFVEDFSKKFPKVNLTIDILKTENILQGLEQDLIDGGIAVTPLAHPSILESDVFNEAFYVYASRGHELLKKKTLKVGDLGRDDLWLLGDGHCFRSQVISLCSAKSPGVFPNLHFQGGDLETLRNLIRRSSGYTLVPELFLEGLSAEEKRQHVRPIEGPVPVRRVSLLYRRNFWKFEILEALKKNIRESLPRHLSSENHGRERLVKIPEMS